MHSHGGVDGLDGGGGLGEGGGGGLGGTGDGLGEGGGGEGEGGGGEGDSRSVWLSSCRQSRCQYCREPNCLPL